MARFSPATFNPAAQACPLDPPHARHACPLQYCPAFPQSASTLQVPSAHSFAPGSQTYPDAGYPQSAFTAHDPQVFPTHAWLPLQSARPPFYPLDLDTLPL